jgi:hypothetical protein
MTRWSYHVEAMNIPERWWRKKHPALFKQPLPEP